MERGRGVRIRERVGGGRRSDRKGGRTRKGGGMC